MNKGLFFIMLILILASTPVFANSEVVIQSSGFYLDSKDGFDNIYFDIYSYLNNKDEATYEINKDGLNKVLFVHQSGQGFTLDELINDNLDTNLEDVLRDLTQQDFAVSYINFSNGKEIVITPPITVEGIEIEPSIYNIPILQNEFSDVLSREYPEFIYNLSNHWVNKSDTQDQINAKIVNLLEDVKAEALLSSPITEKNFDGIMYRALIGVINFKRNEDFRYSLFKAYGPQIDYSYREKKLHPDLIPLSESIRGSILDNYFTLLFDISNAKLYSKDDLDQLLKSAVEGELGTIRSLSYQMLDYDGRVTSIDSNKIFNTEITNSIKYSAILTRADGMDIKPNIIVPISLHSYIDDEVTDITSTTSDFDKLTRKVKILDENGQVIDDIVEELLIYNMTTGAIAKQELKYNQKISNIYVSTQNPRMDYEIYFKTINQKWYKLMLINYSTNQYLINEYIRQGEIK